MASITSVMAAITGPHHVLDCGSTRFTIDNRFSPSKDLAEQVMTARPRHGAPIRVDLDAPQVPLVTSDAPSLGPAVLVSAWTCHHTGRRIFLEILYACSNDTSAADVDRYCNGSTDYDWSRYLDLRGQRIDPNYAIEDPRYPGLERRLGLPYRDPSRSYEVKMTDVY